MIIMRVDFLQVVELYLEREDENTNLCLQNISPLSVSFAADVGFDMKITLL